MTNFVSYAPAMLSGFLCPVGYALLYIHLRTHTPAQTRLDHSPASFGWLTSISSSGLSLDITFSDSSELIKKNLLNVNL